MKLTKSLIPLASLTTLVSSAVIAAPNPDINRRATLEYGNVYMCVNANFDSSAKCQNLGFARGTCHNLYNGFDNAVTSIGPDAGYSCTLWDKQNCDDSGPKLGPGIVAPGISNLADSQYRFNDVASSYRCD